MDYTKDVNKIPYGKYGDLIASGELIVMQIHYDKKYTLVMDSVGGYWKVTYHKDFIAVLTKVAHG